MTALFKAKRTIKEAISAYQDVNDDPLTVALLPPPGETDEERTRRLESIQVAQKVSREIDAEILESKKLFEKKNKAVKILLLGQAESGKSSILKNFQLALAPNNFRSEAKAWKTIIHLNLISSIKIMLDALQDEWHTTANSDKSTPLTDVHRRISMGLSPLLTIANTMNKKIDAYNPDLSNDVCVRPGSAWKTMLGITNSQRPSRPGSPDGKRSDEVASVLNVCQDDIIALWEDPVVKAMLKAHNVRLEESPGFFLNDVARISAKTYTPTDCDIVRARVRTMGVTEHRFGIESATNPGNEWCIYDVGGSRSMRANWIPYFDNVEAIIFLAPLSFHLVLEEDAKINRLEDSICLWREICSNALLADASVILFFNKVCVASFFFGLCARQTYGVHLGKMDILERNLAAGMEVRRYVPSYGSAANDVPSVTRYFREKFRAYHRYLSPKPRAFICHELSAIDTHSTASLLSGVREGILFHQLAETQMI